MPKRPRKQRPSFTAWIVAAAAVYLSHHSKLYTLVPDAAVGPIRACLRRGGGVKASLFSRLLEKRWFRRLVAGWERRNAPGFALHIAARKLYIEAAVRRALAQEFGQVVILGAGYDTLALRLRAEFPKVAFIEVDHPATQRIKTQAALAPVLPAPNLATVAADLAQQPLFDALSACPIFRPQVDTVVIAEGLLMYLDPAAVDSLLNQLRELGAPVVTARDARSAEKVAAASRQRPRLRLVFSFLEPVEGGPPGFPKTSAKFDRWVARREPFRWGIDRNKLAPFLAERGFHASEVAGTQTLRQRVLSEQVPESEPMLQGEYLCIADRR